MALHGNAIYANLAQAISVRFVKVEQKEVPNAERTGTYVSKILRYQLREHLLGPTGCGDAGNLSSDGSAGAENPLWWDLLGRFQTEGIRWRLKLADRLRYPFAQWAFAPEHPKDAVFSCAPARPAEDWQEAFAPSPDEGCSSRGRTARMCSLTPRYTEEWVDRIAEIGFDIPPACSGTFTGALPSGWGKHQQIVFQTTRQ